MNLRIPSFDTSGIDKHVQVTLPIFRVFLEYCFQTGLLDSLLLFGILDGLHFAVILPHRVGYHLIQVILAGTLIGVQGDI